MSDEDEITTPKRHENHHETASFQPIPDEIIFEILSKLPVRSLLRFKSVCKSWYDLLSSPHFVEYHTKLSVSDPYLSRHAIIFKTFTNHSNIMCCPLSPVLSNHTTDAVGLDCCFDGVDLSDRDTFLTVVGCCNGLACVVVQKDEEDKVFLLNPTTRKCYELPKPNAYSSEGSVVEFGYYGFGYDKCSNDYKVVAVVGVTRDERLGTYDSIVEVYSWRTGCWKRIQDFPGGIPHDCRSKFVNGRLYKLGRHLMSGQTRMILVSLDLATEVFAELPLPTAPVGDQFCTMQLGALKDHLCVFYNCERSHAEFWGMNKRSAKKCWTKFGSMPLSRKVGWIDSFLPLFITSTKEILMEYEGSDGSSLALYDVENNSFKYPEIRNVDDLWEANIYIESLVAPNGNNKYEIPQ